MRTAEESDVWISCIRGVLVILLFSKKLYQTLKGVSKGVEASDETIVFMSLYYLSRGHQLLQEIYVKLVKIVFKFQIYENWCQRFVFL